MFRITILAVISLLILASCDQNNPAQKTIPAEKQLAFPQVFDTFQIDQFFRHFHEENPVWCSTAAYRFHYIGQRKDSIYLLPMVRFQLPILPPIDEIEQQTEPEETPFSKYYIEWDDERDSKYTLGTEADIEIRFDTKRKIAGSHPVLLTNTSKDTCLIGYGDYLPLILEARNIHGEWKPIQQRFMYMCGNGVGSILLPPGEMVLTLAPVFNGEYPTQLRFCFGKNYSKPFPGNIHYTQFDFKPY
ncbi:hypothetical protein [Fluviicola sp.]|uniref:hypothetical protein n=1 Tax=Fluviicola sp. TaxID=1917219 RepID=UPI0031DBEAD5